MIASSSSYLARGSGNLKFCEDELAPYSYHPWIAETLNSFSNIAYTIVAIYGLLQYYNSHKSSGSSSNTTTTNNNSKRSLKLPESFFYAEVVIGLISIGSFLFHAHQSRIAEWTDEVPMCILAGLYAQCMKNVHPLTTVPTKFYTVTQGIAILLWILYLITHWYDCFLLCFTLQILLALWLPYDASSLLNVSKTKWWITVWFLGTAKAAWEIEQYLFKHQQCHTHWGTIYLHPYWHIGSAIAHAVAMSTIADLYYAAAAAANNNKK